MVASLDESVRQLVTTLKRKRLYDNTVIIFTTDNGAAAGGLDMSAGSNFPLRGVKNTLWEGGVRGVAFVHSPLIKRGGKNEIISNSHESLLQEKFHNALHSVTLSFS